MSKVKVAVRVRPFVGSELRDSCISIVGKTCSLIVDPEIYSFTFDHGYSCVQSVGIDSNQDLWNDIGRPALQCAVDGFNCCIFAYGTTGSGKSFSIRGDDGHPGILPRLCQHLFTEVISRDDLHQYSVLVSYYEIHNERVLDLLSPSPSHKGLKVMVLPNSSTGNSNVIVKDLEKRVVHNYKEIHELLQMGSNRLTFNRTLLNERASRSHSIFTVFLNKRETNGRSRVSQINIIDLAGSEHVKLSGVEGDTLKETCHINHSLTALARVIDAINFNCDKQPSLRRHVPYRDSKLTTILSSSLGGNSKTYMIATVSPSRTTYMDTLRTLKFAEGVSRVVNYVKVNGYVNEILKELAKEQQYLSRRYKTPKSIEDEDDEEKLKQFVKFYQLMKESECVRQYPKLLFLNKAENIDGVFYKIIDQEGFTLLGHQFSISHDAEEVVMVVSNHCNDIMVNGTRLTSERTLLKHGDRIFMDDDHIFVLSHLQQIKTGNCEDNGVGVHEVVNWKSAKSEVSNALQKETEELSRNLNELVDKLELHLITSYSIECKGEGVKVEHSDDSPTLYLSKTDSWKKEECDTFLKNNNPFEEINKPVDPKPVVMTDIPMVIPLSDLTNKIITNPLHHTKAPSDSKIRSLSGSYSSNYNRRKTSISKSTSSITKPDAIVNSQTISTPTFESKNPLEGNTFTLNTEVIHEKNHESDIEGNTTSDTNSQTEPGLSSVSSCQSDEPLTIPIEYRKEVDILIKKMKHSIRHDCWLDDQSQWIKDWTNILLSQSIRSPLKFIMNSFLLSKSIPTQISSGTCMYEDCGMMNNYVLEIMDKTTMEGRRLILQLQDCLNQNSHMLTPYDIKLLVNKVEKIYNEKLVGQCYQNVVNLRQPFVPPKLLFYGCNNESVHQTLHYGLQVNQNSCGIIMNRVIVATPNPSKAFLHTKDTSKGSYHNQIFVCECYVGSQKLVKDTEVYENTSSIGDASYCFPWNEPNVRSRNDSVHISKQSSGHSDEYLFWNSNQIIPKYLITLEVKDLLNEMSEEEIARLQYERTLRKQEVEKLHKATVKLQTENAKSEGLKQDRKEVKSQLLKIKEQVEEFREKAAQKELYLASEQARLEDQIQEVEAAQARIAKIEQQLKLKEKTISTSVDTIESRKLQSPAKTDIKAPNSMGSPISSLMKKLLEGEEQRKKLEEEKRSLLLETSSLLAKEKSLRHQLQQLTRCSPNKASPLLKNESSIELSDLAVTEGPSTLKGSDDNTNLLQVGFNLSSDDELPLNVNNLIHNTISDPKQDSPHSNPESLISTTSVQPLDNNLPCDSNENSEPAIETPTTPPMVPLLELYNAKNGNLSERTTPHTMDPPEWSPRTRSSCCIIS